MAGTRTTLRAGETDTSPPAFLLFFSFLSSSNSVFYPRQQINTVSSFLTIPFVLHQCSLATSPLHSDQTMMFRHAAIGRIFSGQERSRSLSTITSCRAVLVPRFGRPDVLEVRADVSVPDLKPKEVLVRSRAVAINPLDLRVSSIPISCVISWSF